jgi:hypothetical protein
MAADITDGRALGGNLLLIRSPRLRGRAAPARRSNERVPLELVRYQHHLQEVDIPKPENLEREMPRKSAAELEAECLRLLAMDPHTRGIKRVEIIRIYPKGTGPNWTHGALDPMPTRAGLAIAQTLIASVYGRWALAD